jgi:hypothetical protein
VDGALNERADIFNNSSRGGARRLTFQDSRFKIKWSVVLSNNIKDIKTK